jgi:hypothetical protein
MICNGCQNSMVQGFKNGEQVTEVVSCLLTGEPIRNGLIECSGYQPKGGDTDGEAEQG